MGRLLALFLLFLAFLISFAQPGICMCWVQPDIQQNHPHILGQDQVEHDHGYLQNYNLSNVAVILFLWMPHGSVFVELLACTGLGRKLTMWVIIFSEWRDPPQTPPPRMLIPV